MEQCGLMEIEIVEMILEDVPEVAAIESMLFSQPWSERGFLESMKSRDTLYLVVKMQEKIIGYCGLLQSFEEADITNVAVHPEWQGKGIAFQMLQKLMELGRAKGIERYTLEVRVSNTPAVRVYEKLGFSSVGIRKNFYDMPREDAMIMWTE